MSDREYFRGFVAESNRIEGIGNVTTDEMDAHFAFVTNGKATIPDLQLLVSVLQPDAVLRDKGGLDVRVGNHVAPRGGPAIRTDLKALLETVAMRTPFDVHRDYETLHPFTDGNGRSGRALWLWQMFQRDGHLPPLRFLHTYYYQSLEASR